MKDKVAMFGASKLGADFVKNNRKYQIVACIDNDKSKIGKTFHGHKICSADSLKQSENCKVIITSSFHQQISVQLEMMGIVNYEIYTDHQPAYKERTIQYLCWLFFKICPYVVFLLRMFTRKNNNRTLHIMPKSGFADQFQAYFTQNDDFIIWQADNHYSKQAEFKEDQRLHIRTPQVPIPLSVSYFQLIWKLASYQLVIVHAYRKFLVSTVGFSLGLTKVGWVAWGGGDLYASEHSASLLNRVWKQSKSEFKHVFVFTQYDILTLKNRYRYDSSTSVEVYFNPLSAALKGVSASTPKTKTTGLTVMVGHAAYSHLEHKSLLSALPKATQPSIILPLSYGSEKYQLNMFNWLETFDANGCEVSVLKSYLSPKAYLEVVRKINIFILHSHNQVGLSTLYLMLYLGKSIYLNQKNSVLWTHLVDDLGFHCFDYAEVFDAGELKTLKPEQVKFNIELGKQFFDESAIYHNWKRSIESM